MGLCEFSISGTEFITFGYRVTEVNLPDVLRPDPTFRLAWINSKFDRTTRHPVRVSLGCHLIGAASPVPDLKHTHSALLGVEKRVATNMPLITRARLRRLRRFTDRWLKKNFSQYIFAPDERFEFDEWIEQTPYTRMRKEQLRTENDKAKNCMFDQKWSKVKCHVKDECYSEYKYPRGIYSRTDAYKTLVGPFFDKLGSNLFKSRWFIKTIPVHERPAKLLELFGDKPNLYCTDYSSFEATFVAQLMRVVEFRLYRFVLQNHPWQDVLLKLISVISRSSRCEFWSFCFTIVAKRMSGEMNTSLGNGFFNMILSFFLAEEVGNKYYDGMFEGDDGIQWVDRVRPTAQNYRDYGCNIKIDIPTCMNEASFCGNVFDVDAKDIVVNPIEAILSFAYTGKQYIKASRVTKLALLKAKSLSMLYTYPACPMLRAVALYGLRITNHIKIDVTRQKISKSFEYRNLYNKQQMEDALDNYDKLMEDSRVSRQIHINTRILVQNKYKIPMDMQIRFEEYMNNKQDLSPIVFKELLEFVHPDTIDYFNTYGANINVMNDTSWFSVSRVYPKRIYPDGLQGPFFTVLN